MNLFKPYFENPDGSVTVGDKVLTVGELEKLKVLMPDAHWLGILYARPEDITNPSYEPSPDHAEFLENYAKDPAQFLTFNKPLTNEH